MAEFKDLRDAEEPQRDPWPSEAAQHPLTDPSPIPRSMLVPYGPDPVRPFGPAPSTLGPHFFYPSQQEEPGMPYVKNNFVYRCRGLFDNVNAALAARVATQNYRDNKREAGEKQSPVDPALQHAINEAVISACHRPPEESQSPFLEDLNARRERGGSPWSDLFKRK